MPRRNGDCKPARVLFVWDGEYPWDVRVEKFCQTLTSEGHEVHLVCRNRRGQPRYEYHQDIHIHRIAAVPNWISKAINEALTFPFFLNPLWISTIAGVILRYKCRLIVVRDLPMAPAYSREAAFCNAGLLSSRARYALILGYRSSRIPRARDATRVNPSMMSAAVNSSPTT